MHHRLRSINHSFCNVSFLRVLHPVFPKASLALRTHHLLCPDNKDINIERTEEALSFEPKVIATGCPFCNTMMTDGVKHFNKNAEVEVKDIVELLAEAEDL